MASQNSLDVLLQSFFAEFGASLKFVEGQHFAL